MNTKHKVNDEQVVHVRLNKPTSIRKEILKTAIDVTKIIQDAESLNVLRSSELALIWELKSIGKEIESLQKNLVEKDLPKLPIERQEKLKVHVEEVKLKEVSDIDRLKAELAAIENKLKDL